MTGLTEALPLVVVQWLYKMKPNSLGELNLIISTHFKVIKG